MSKKFKLIIAPQRIKIFTPAILFSLLLYCIPLYNLFYMKKKFAVLTSGWVVDYVTDCIQGMREACTAINADLYVFCCYKYLEPSGTPNTTGFAIFDLINFTDYNGIIIMPNLFNDDKIVEKIRKRIVESKVPAISLCQKLDGLHFLNTHNYQVFKELILHLIQHHKVSKFAFIGGPKENKGSITNFKAFKDALDESNIPVSEDDIYENPEWSYKTAYAQAEKIFSKQQIPQAIVCINDASAMAAISVSLKHGYRVPDDVKIIGCDDLDVSGKVIPSITSLNSNPKRLGERAISILFSKPAELIQEDIHGIPIYRQSCGCQKIVTNDQIQFSQSYTTAIDTEQRFASQMRHLENTFINFSTVESLSKNLQLYFQERHSFEGPDFAIMINKTGVDNLKNEQIIQKSLTPFDSQVQAIVSLKDGIAVHREQINTRDLIPSSLQSDESTLYFFLPIYNQTYVYGYYVSKNFINLIENKRAYNWIRNFGNILEKYRQTSIYRITSEKYKILSTQDALSGLYNREGLNRYGIKLFESNRRSRTDTTILFVDINDMKIINDRYGHLQGDLAIKTVAESISNCVPQSYVAIRYGGDEFVIIGEKNSSNYAMKIKKEIKAKVKKMELPYDITVSIGSKTFSAYENITLENAIKTVDEIMYVEKVKYHLKNK